MTLMTSVRTVTPMSSKHLQDSCKMWTYTTSSKHFVLMELSCVTHCLSLSFFLHLISLFTALMNDVVALAASQIRVMGRANVSFNLF